ncbi:MAG: Curli production assembly/transport component CsgG [Lentisphaerae bacterium ADurb.Bin242]|nr:MAG: Curli production assembly/transport component CsgG [Lentisphaerae bacterium ADurb.Bin242]
MKKMLFTLLCGGMLTGMFAEEVPEPIQFIPTVAVLPFEGRGRVFEDDAAGKSVAELLSVALMERGTNTVERAELDKALMELHLSAVGLVDKDSQVKLGRLVGAKILIAGSVFKSGDKTFVVAKVIGTETSRVVGASAGGKSTPAELIPELSKKVIALLEKRGEILLPSPLNQKSVAETLAQTVQGRQRTVYVKITENINLPTPDPAAQTEIERLLLALGFKIVPSRQDAEFTVTGEAFAEQAPAYGKFISAAARIELKVIAVKGEKLLASGAQKERLAGVTYQVAAKEAIAQAALCLAGELLSVLK